MLQTLPRQEYPIKPKQHELILVFRALNKRGIALGKFESYKKKLNPEAFIICIK